MPLEKMAAEPWLESGATNSRVAYEGVRIPEGSPPVYREDEPLQLKRRTNQRMREDKRNVRCQSDKAFEHNPACVPATPILSYRLRMLPNVLDRLSCSERPDSMRAAGAAGAETAVDR